MCGCSDDGGSFVCAACWPRHKTDLVLLGSLTEPPTPEEEAYGRRGELSSLETVRGLSE